MDSQVFIRVLAGSGLFCLIATVGLRFLPRRLSRKAVEAMEKILHPVSNVSLVLLLIVFAGSGLLRLLHYREPANWLMGSLIVLALTILWPVMSGYAAAHNEITKRKLAEEGRK